MDGRSRYCGRIDTGILRDTIADQKAVNNNQ